MTAFTKTLTASAGFAPELDAERTSQMLMRVLANVADSGTDFLGNIYRSAVTNTSVANISATPVLDPNGFWLSQPNPSSFAVESLYLDMRVNDLPQVIDRFTVDPLTPNIYFHVYYSSDPSGPGNDPTSWDNLLWTPVYKTFQAVRQETYAFPMPITAKYLKVEFTNLQARSYDPGAFQVPSTFRKHPKWVLDYFLAQFAQRDHDFVSTGIDLTYDALDLAFAYYKTDLIQNPDPPPLAQNPTPQQIAFFQHENAADQIDTQTLGLIRIAFQPFTSQPALLGRLTTILGAYAQSSASDNYSTEVIQTAIGDTNTVTNLVREPLIIEKSFPVMSFFLPCRHGYRISQSLFEQNIAYFAGIKSLAFHRDVYTSEVDQLQYNEPLGDGTNLLVNDWA